MDAFLRRSEQKIASVDAIKLNKLRGGMRFSNINVFVAWFLIPETLIMGWLAAIGRVVLELCGLATTEEGVPGRLVGAILLFAAIFFINKVRGSLPPEGNPQVSSYKFGHKLVLLGNLLAIGLFLFPFTYQLVESKLQLMLISKFTIAFGYLAVGCWAIGFSILYQSSQPARTTAD